MTSAGASQRYTLYGTAACHLCELAEALLQAECRANARITFKKVDISVSEDLFQRYGVRIPVLQDPAGRELGWPFSAAELRAFVG